jgi:hypothetical protein
LPSQLARDALTLRALALLLDRLLDVELSGGRIHGGPLRARPLRFGEALSSEVDREGVDRLKRFPCITIGTLLGIGEATTEIRF